MDATKAQLGEPMSVVGVAHRNVAEELQEQKWLKDSWKPKPTTAWVSGHKAGNMEPTVQL